MTAQRETGPSEERPAPKSPAKATPTQDTTRHPNQTEIVLALLLDQPAVCSSEFYRRYLPRFGARIWELRQQGYVIWRRSCDDPDHPHRNRAFLYELIAVPSREAAR